MTLAEYQYQAGRTTGAGFEPLVRLATSGRGIAGEAGEVADMVKKQIGHGHTTDIAKMQKELGDVLWYVTDLATQYGLSLQQIGEANIAKLKARYPEGFSQERSQNRAEYFDSREKETV